MGFRLASPMRNTRIQATVTVTNGEGAPPPMPAVMLWLIQFVGSAARSSPYITGWVIELNALCAPMQPTVLSFVPHSKSDGPLSFADRAPSIGAVATMRGSVPALIVANAP